MDDAQKAARAIVERRLRETGLDLTGLARAAGVMPSTLTRFMNSETKHTLSAKTLWKLEDVPPVTRSRPGRFEGEPGAVALYLALSPEKRRLVDNLIRDLAGLPDEANGRDPPLPFAAGDNQRDQGGCDNVVPIPSRKVTAA